MDVVQEKAANNGFHLTGKPAAHVVAAGLLAAEAKRNASIEARPA